MKKKKIYFLILTATLFLSQSVTVLAVTESDVEAVGKDTAAGNVFIWFLCAIAFLKISQKIDSFLSSLGINVGHTGGNMMAELMVAARGLTTAKNVAGSSSFRGGSFRVGGNSSSVSANKMLLLLWPYMESYIKQVREDIKNHTNKAETEMGEQLAGGAPLPGGLGKPVSGKKGKHDPGSDEDDRTQLQQVLDYEDGRIELEKTDEIGEDGNGGTSRTSDYAGSGYVSQAAEDMERIMTQLAEDAAYASYEQELSEELQAESDKIRYGNAHRGVHVNVNRMGYVDSSYMEAYQKVAPPLLLISKRLQKQVSQILKDYREGGKLDNLPMGKRINVRNAVRNDGRLFYKLKLPNDRTDIAVAVLNDESGSMNSANRITYARSASIILHDFCRGLGIPVAIYGHTEFNDVELYAYAEFDSIDNKDHYRLMDMSARSGNRDGAALRYVAERLMTRPEAIKLLIVISDGQPAADNYYGTEAEADLRGIKKEYSARGIQMFAAAIGSDKPNIQRIYGDGFLDITNLEKLPVNLGRLIIQKVKNQYAA